MLAALQLARWKLPIDLERLIEKIGIAQMGGYALKFWTRWPLYGCKPEMAEFVNQVNGNYLFSDRHRN
jgi:hypothetical protein